MTRSSYLTVALVAILGASALAAAVAPATPVDPYGLSQHYRHYELEWMDAGLVLADASDGAVSLTLQGVTYDLLVEPAPWASVEQVVMLHADGTQEVQPLEFPSRAFLGSVDGVAGSRALLSLTEGGVAGFVETDPVHVGFSPLVGHDKNAPAGLSVVYLQQDVITPEVWDDHPELLVLADDSESTEAPIGILSHQPGPDRTIKLKADSDMVDNTNFVTRISNGYNTMNSGFQTMAGFNFNLKDNSIYSCGDEACDDSWGMNYLTTGTLLQNWGNKERDFGGAFDLAMLFTTNDVKNSNGDVVGGAAWQPGRYGFVRSTGFSDANFAKTMAHEAGHNFNGDHDMGGFPGRATSYSHDHGSNHVHTTNHCHLFVPATSICLQNHEHQTNHWHADVYTHFEIMNYPSGTKQEWVYKLGSTSSTTSNYYFVRSCNYNSWSSGTRDSGSEIGFGSYCTDN